MSTPDPDLAPKFPPAWQLVDEIVRSDLDPDGVLEAVFGGDLDGEPALVVDGWTPTRIDGVEGLADYLLWLSWMVRSGTQLDPVQVAPSMLDPLLRGLGATQDLIDSIRGNAPEEGDAERWLRKLGIMLPLLLMWKGTRSGGGTGGLQRALRVLSGHEVPLRECFWWQRWLVDPSTPVPADHLLGVSAIASSIDEHRFDLYVVDWPVGDFTIQDAVVEAIRMSSPPETVFVHFARWVDEFLGDDASNWSSSLQAGDTLVETPPTTRLIAPAVNPLNPGGELVLSASGVAGDRYIYPRTGDSSVHGTGCLALDHFVDAVLVAEVAGGGTSAINLDVGWDPSTGGGYRVLVKDDGVVELRADTVAPIATVRASAGPCFIPGTLSTTGVRVTVSVLAPAGGTKTVRVYVDDTLVITWADVAPVVTTAGSVRILDKVINQDSTCRWFLWHPNPQPPTVVSP